MMSHHTRCLLPSAVAGNPSVGLYATADLTSGDTSCYLSTVRLLIEFLFWVTLTSIVINETYCTFPFPNITSFSLGRYILFETFSKRFFLTDIFYYFSSDFHGVPVISPDLLINFYGINDFYDVFTSRQPCPKQSGVNWGAATSIRDEYAEVHSREPLANLLWRRQNAICRNEICNGSQNPLRDAFQAFHSTTYSISPSSTRHLAVIYRCIFLRRDSFSGRLRRHNSSSVGPGVSMTPRLTLKSAWNQKRRLPKLARDRKRNSDKIERLVRVVDRGQSDGWLSGLW